MRMHFAGEEKSLCSFRRGVLTNSEKIANVMIQKEAELWIVPSESDYKHPSTPSTLPHTPSPVAERSFLDIYNCITASLHLTSGIERSVNLMGAFRESERCPPEVFEALHRQNQSPTWADVVGRHEF